MEAKVLKVSYVLLFPVNTIIIPYILETVLGIAGQPISAKIYLILIANLFMKPGLYNTLTLLA